MKNDSTKIILKGTWLYDGSVGCSIQISETNFKPGSGDFLDPEDVRNDQYGVYYNIQYFSHEGNLVSEVQGCESLEQAKKLASKNCDSLVWF